MSDAIERPIPQNLFARLSQATRYVIAGVAPDSWFGPLEPLAPQAPPDVKGRQFDYSFGANLNYVPRAEAGIGFAELRALADALPLLRAVIETRKDQVATQSFSVRARKTLPDAPAHIEKALAFLARPDRRRSFADWLRMLLEDLLVIDAATIYPRYDRGGNLYSLDVIDGATIKPLIGEDGRAPEPPDPAFQQVLHGVPAADFSGDELLYLPRNLRAHRLYGMSPVEQVALTVNIALRREAATLDYYRTGSSPDAFATLPKEWTADQIRSFQDYFDALMSGNSARRRMLKFMPSDFRLIETRQPPLKDQYDEWLARVICYAFSVPATPFVAQVNRATSETMRMQATQEGLLPLKTWIKSALDTVIQVCMGEPGLEFVWVGDDAVDPLQQAQTLQILVSAGIKTREEARADLGLSGGKAEAGLGKFNPYHDEQGRFTTAEGAVAPGGDAEQEPKAKPQPQGVQVALDDRVMSDAGETALGSAIALSDQKPAAETGTTAAVLNTRSRIASIASKYIDSIAWSNDATNGRYGPHTNKCNLFVYDVLTEAGASPGRPHGVWPFSSYPPLASDWANPGYAIPGWAVLGPKDRPEEGDVIAQRISHCDAGGHVMIVGPSATLIGTGDSDPQKPFGTVEQIPMQSTLANRSDVPQGPLVFRRWVGR